MAKITTHEEGHLICHCLLVESSDGLILVDTGFGRREVAAPRVLGRGFMFVAGPRLRDEDTAIAQVERLGWKSSDVRHILPTHLDVDHAGGIPDFPGATVRCFAPEHEAAQAGSFRYRPHQFKDARFELIPKNFQGDDWMGFSGVRPFGPDLAIIPLIGHTRGHTVVAVRDDKGWMLHCGDAYYHRAQLDGGKVPWGLKIFQRLNDEDAALARKNRARLGELRRTKGRDVRVFCAHDPTEYRDFA